MKYELFNWLVLFSSTIELFKCSFSFGKSGNPNQSQWILLCFVGCPRQNQNKTENYIRQGNKGEGMQEAILKPDMPDFTIVLASKSWVWQRKSLPRGKSGDSDSQWHREIFLNFIKCTVVLGVLHSHIVRIIAFLHTYILQLESIIRNLQDEILGPMRLIRV